MTEHNFDQLDQLASDYWKWRAFHQPNSSDDIPRIERPRGWEPDWSQASVERQRAALAAFTERWKSMDVSAWPIPRQADYRLIGAALARVGWSWMFCAPGNAIRGFMFIKRSERSLRNCSRPGLSITTAARRSSIAFGAFRNCSRTGR